MGGWPQPRNLLACSCSQWYAMWRRLRSKPLWHGDGNHLLGWAWDYARQDHGNQVQQRQWAAARCLNWWKQKQKQKQKRSWHQRHAVQCVKSERYELNKRLWAQTRARARYCVRAATLTMRREGWSLHCLPTCSMVPHFTGNGGVDDGGNYVAVTLATTLQDN